MIPPLIIDQAQTLGIDLLAITDHNACANVRSVVQAAYNCPVTVLAGMELQTREEVHLLCLFDTLEQAEAWESWVTQFFPPLSNDPQSVGEQFVVDAEGELIRSETRMLLASAEISLEKAVEQVRAFEGLAIPAHIDRRANGLITQLGLIPPGFEALEVSRHISPAQARLRYPQMGDIPLVQNGDVHYLDGFLGSTFFTVEEPSIAEICLALRGEGGRKMWVEG